MEQLQRGGKGDTLCLNASCVQCKRYNQRKVVMCRNKDCAFFAVRFTLRDREGKERPYTPEYPEALAANFPRQTLRTRGF
jgi:hypothetical protein